MVKGSHHSEKSIEKIRKTKTGVPLSPAHRKAIGVAHLDKFMKVNVGYSAVHKWADAKMGKPKKCQECGFMPRPRIRRRIQWANRSGNYLREANDWIPLCVPCHKKYDSGKLKLKLK